MQRRKAWLGPVGQIPRSEDRTPAGPPIDTPPITVFCARQRLAEPTSMVAERAGACGPRFNLGENVPSTAPRVKTGCGTVEARHCARAQQAILALRPH